MSVYHQIKGIQFVGDVLELIIDGAEKRFKLEDISAALENATDKERRTFSVSPAGYGIHWPLLDEDLSIDGLLGIVNAPVRKRKTA